MTFNFVEVIEILGTASFAVSGASVAIRKRLDIFGVLVIAFATAIGGGTLRDIMLGTTPVAWLKDESTVIVIFVSAIGTLFFDSSEKIPRAHFLFDTLGLGLFTIVGIEKALSVGLGPAMCIAIGTITACFGGVIRDVLLTNVPVIFQKEIYASACIAGGILYFVCHLLGVDDRIAQLVCMATIVTIRILAIRFHLSLPSFHLSPSNHET
jgi:uncharacterized membrane protein YeiH